VFVHVTFMRVVQMTVVQVIQVAFVANRGVPAFVGMLVVVASMRRMRVVHRSSTIPQSGALTWSAPDPGS